MHIETPKDGSIKISQPHLINQILDDMRLNKENVKVADTPALSSVILKRLRESENFNGHFKY